jgi:hypothetical protein
VLHGAQHFLFFHIGRKSSMGREGMDGSELLSPSLRF